MKFKRIIAFVACLIMIVAAIVPASAITPYSTYTYSVDGFALISPDAYVPD